MASKSVFLDLHQPIRSISLPSRIHPPSVKLQAAFNQLKQSNSPPSTSESLHFALINLEELYNRIHESFQSSSDPSAFSGSKIVEKALDGSIILLDACDIARNTLLTLREHVQTLQSAFRRREKPDSSVKSYIRFRKNSRKEISKALRSLRKLESKLLDFPQENGVLENTTKEASLITVSILRSLLLFLSSPAAKTKGGYSMISKLITLRSFSSEKTLEMNNEVQRLDLALEYVEEAEMVQELLVSVDSCIDGLEAGLNSVFKCLVRNRVSILNILTSH